VIELFRLLSELIILFREFKNKEKRTERRRALREAIHEARTNKDTKMLERFFDPDINATDPTRMWNNQEKKRVLEGLRETNKHKTLGS